MLRRSSRIAIPGPAQPEDDNASTGSVGNNGQISYKENHTRIFRRKTGGRKTGLTHTTSRVTSAESMGHFSEDPYEDTEYWDMIPTPRPGFQRKGSFSSQSSRSSLAPSVRGGLTDVQGQSSGYSSEEEAYRQRFNSSQPAAHPKFGFQDAVRSPARGAAMLFWWLGTAWYSLMSSCSLLNVFLLSRRTAAARKVIVLFLLFIFLVFGLWYWYPYVFSLLTPKAQEEPKAVHPSTAANVDAPQAREAPPDLSAVHDDIAKLLQQQETRWQRERERMRQAEEMWRREKDREWGGMKREIELLQKDSQELHLQQQTLMTSLHDLKASDKSVENEHRSWLGQEMAGIDQHIHDLQTEVSSLHTATSLLKEELEFQQLANAKLKVELSEWLVEYLSKGGGGAAGVVLRPDLQGALESLETKLLKRLAEDRDREKKDIWRSVGETLQEEGMGAVTLQDVQQVVRRALSLYHADGIGMADYALESSGASVINTRCSETYRTRTACVSLFGLPLWYHSESPRTVIQPEVYPGKCWAFKGSEGFLVISLSYPVRISHVTLEHLPKVLSPTGNITSAPRNFSIYGMSAETEQGTLLGTFAYDQDGEPVQTFKLPDSVTQIYSMVELRIHSNWGHPEYTCVYRFRVHGNP